MHLYQLFPVGFVPVGTTGPLSILGVQQVPLSPLIRRLAHSLTRLKTQVTQGRDSSREPGRLGISHGTGPSCSTPLTPTHVGLVKHLSWGGGTGR